MRLCPDTVDIGDVVYPFSTPHRAGRVIHIERDEAAINPRHILIVQLPNGEIFTVSHWNVKLLEDLIDDHKKKWDTYNTLLSKCLAVPITTRRQKQ